jgi:MinD-like ATPase involved in chromosome partitioning or flagellar assembly
MNNSSLISIISNKGGTGKTSISICFAYYFSKIKNKKTLLIELDSSPGDFGVLFGIGPEKSIEMALKFPSKLRNYVRNFFDNLDVLKGFSNPILAENIDPKDTYELFSIIQETYDVVIIDTQNVINGIILDVLKISRFVFLLSETSVESVFRNVELVNLLKGKFNLDLNNLFLLINKKRILDFLNFREISKLTSFPIFGFVTYDKHFDKSMVLSNKEKIFNTRLFSNVNRILNNFYICNWEK